MDHKTIFTVEKIASERGGVKDARSAKKRPKSGKASKRDGKATRNMGNVDISAQVARARRAFVTSRDELANRVENARLSFPQSNPAVMLG